MDRLKQSIEQHTKPSGLYILSSNLGVEAIKQIVDTSGYYFFYIDGKQVANAKQFLDRVSSTLEFPDWFGGNWDALFDCLADMSWVPAKGYVLLYEHFERFIENDPENFFIASRHMEDAALSGDDSSVMYILLRGNKEMLIPILPQIEVFDEV